MALAVSTLARGEALADDIPCARQYKLDVHLWNWLRK